MPMMASSTNTPSATAKPPSVMVLSVRPARSSTATAASSDRGMARKVISAERQSRRNRNSTTRIRTAAINSECSRLDQRPLDEIGRAVQRRIDGDALRLQCRRQVAKRRFHGTGGVQGIGAILAGQRQQHAACGPDQRIAGAQRRRLGHGGDLADGDRRLAAHRQHRAAHRADIRRRHGCLDQHPLMRQIDKAGAAQGQRRARRIGQVGQGEAIGRHALQIGLDLNLAHRAAEHDDMRDARDRQQAPASSPTRPGRAVRKATSLSDVSPILSRSMVLEVSGDSCGVSTPGGSALPNSLSRSEMPWRALLRSILSANWMVMTDRPGMDSERMVASPGVPLTAFSIGLVTSCSTCSAVKPGASV